jgi:Ser/Thr protein kinase RdoA (MazF antagonist)
MDNKTKYAIEVDGVASLVKAGFGPSVTVSGCRELTGGTFNAAYLVTLDGTRDLVLKVAPDPDLELLTYEVDLLRTEVHVGRRARAAGLPVAAPVLADYSRALVPTDYAFFEWLPGRPLTDVPDATPAVRHELGRHAARLHTLSNAWFGYPRRDGRTRSPSWRVSFRAIMADILADARRWATPLPVPASRIVALLDRHDGLLDDIRTPALVHYDLWDGNVLTTGNAVSGLIDGERAFYGDPLAEFASLALLRDLDAIPDVLAGYAAATGRPFALDGRGRRRLAMYRAYLHLIMMVEGESRGLPAADLDQRVAVVGAALDDDLRALSTVN